MATPVTGGDTNVVRYFQLRKSADGKAATGLTITGIDLQYTRSLAASATKTDAIVGTGGATTHVDNKVFELDATNSPGLYMVCFADPAFAAGVPEVILTVKEATIFSTSMAVPIDPPVNVTKISGDSAAADNVELDYDGTGYDKSNSTIGTTTVNTDMVGTDSAALASVCTEGRLAELDAANLPSDLDDVLTDTGTTLDTKLNDIQGATFSSATDSLEAIRDRGDAEWTTGAGGNDRLLMVNTTIATLASQTSFTLTAGSADDNAYRNCTIVIEDAITSVQKAMGLVSAYTGASKTVTLKYDPGVFTIAATDKVYILAENALKSTAVNRQLDVTATGAAGIDWGNVENKGTANDLSGTDIQLCDTVSVNTDMVGTDNAFLASVGGALDDVAAAGDPSSIDTLVQYAKQVINTLEGAVGIPAFPTGVDPANNVSLAEAIRAIRDDVTGIAGAVMRGTDSAALASVCTEGRLAELDAANLPTTTDDILADTGSTGVLLAATATSAQLVDDIWDEVLTGATHNVNNSSGKRLRTIDAAFEVHSGTAQAGSSTTITLDTGASTVNGIYNGDRIIITGGTGAQEHGIVIGYVGSTRVATMSKTWVVTPDATSEFEVVPADVDVETWNTTTVTGAGDLAQIETDTAAILVDTGTTIPATITTLQADTDDIQTRLPAALVSGRMDSSIDATGMEVGAIDAIFQRQMTESYNTDGTAPTLEQALMLTMQSLTEFAIAGTTITTKKVDGSTTAATYTLDDATNPTSRTRAT